MDTSLTTLHEEDIVKHLPVAQSLVTRFVALEAAPRESRTELAGTRRRFVSTVSTAGQRTSREVEFAKTLAKIVPTDSMLTPAEHNILYKTRRALCVALAVSDLFARQTGLDALHERNAASVLEGPDAGRYRDLMEASAYVAAFTAAAYVKQLIEADGEPVSDVDVPGFNFATPLDALKSLVAGLDSAADGSADDTVLAKRIRAFADEALEDLLARKSRFAGLGPFEDTHLRLDSDGFELNGFDVVPGARSRPLVMTFKKPNEIIGNHIAKYQAMKLAKMLMAYDFDRQLNPFVELGGFTFTFIGDGAPGTGKTILIQMIAGLLNDYCQIAGYGFTYENFGVDQISSYQGKSGQNCKQFINNVMNPRTIGFGTVDDIDQVAARRSDDRASAGQQEVTAVLMESFGGATTVVRGNCAFGMFSNYPENVDDALRQRAGARWLVDGPQTRDDYIDIFVLLAGKNHQIPLGDHDLYAAQVIEKAVSVAYEEHSRPQEEGLQAVYERFAQDHGKLDTMEDIGTYLHMIKQAEPRFTGRAIKNITDAVKMRAMDVDLPEEWFEKPEVFMHKSYDEKKAMIEELRGPFTIEMVMQEINRYADSEFRYSDRADAAAVAEIVRRTRQQEKAIRRISELKESGDWGA
jgi:ATPase family associated with various cellular activities (AAA)